MDADDMINDEAMQCAVSGSLCGLVLFGLLPLVSPFYSQIV